MSGLERSPAGFFIFFSDDVGLHQILPGADIKKTISTSTTNKWDCLWLAMRILMDSLVHGMAHSLLA